MEKKNGGIRPIAIGEVLRRVVGKVLCQEVKQAAQDYFWPRQVGVGAQLGADSAVHSVRQWCERHAADAGKVVLKLDFENAFNCVDRGAALRELRGHFPSLSRWAQWCYGQHSSLYFGRWDVASQTGVQQGDPIGPLLFACCIHPLVLRLDRVFREGLHADPHGLCLFYLDDGMLCGEAGAVAECLRLVAAEGGQLGLRLKLSKCELIVPAGQTRHDLSALFPRGLLVDERGENRVIWSGGFEFLGAPIGTAAFCESHAAARAEQARSLLAAIAELPDPQVGLRLIRSCGGFCRLVFSARVVGPDLHATSLRAFDGTVRAAVSELTALSLSDQQWAQAGRSFRTGGLGLRGERHAAAAYLASRAATRDKCAEIDPHFVWDISSTGSDVARAFALLAAVLPPEARPAADDPRLASQKHLSKLVDEADLSAQLASAGAAERANLRSETLWGASGFLSAVPSKALGLAMGAAEFTEEVKARLWIHTYAADHFCPCCDAVSDRHGCHSRRCTGGGDLTACHNGARNIVHWFAASAGANPSLEQAGLLPPRPDDPSGNNLRRPADVFLPSWVHGQPAAFDLAITSPQRQGVVAQASLTTGFAAAEYEARKRSFLNSEEECRQQGILFVPLVAETSGGWGASALTTFRKLAKLAGGRGGRASRPEALMPQFLERLSVSIRSAKARAVLRRAGAALGADGSPADAAAVVLAACA